MDKKGYALKKWVEGLSDEACYPLGFTQKKPTFATEQKKGSIH